MKTVPIYKYRIKENRRTKMSCFSDHILNEQEIAELLIKNLDSILNMNNLEFYVYIDEMITVNAPSYNESTDL